MTDHELSVKMVMQGLHVFEEVSKQIKGTEFMVITAPVLVMACINAAVQVHMMKQLAGALSGKEVEVKR